VGGDLRPVGQHDVGEEALVAPQEGGRDKRGGELHALDS
jgi:hypothetical protein